MWNYINNKLGNSAKKCEIDKIKIGDKFPSVPVDIANEFNDFFTNVGLKLANNIQLQPHHTVNLERKNSCQETLFLRYTDPKEINKIICNLKKKKEGIDNIHATVLKKISNYINPALSKIIINAYIWGTGQKH